MDGCGLNHFATQIDLQKPIRFVLHRGENRLIAKFGCAGILGQDLVANLHRLDRLETGKCMDRCAGCEA